MRKTSTLMYLYENLEQNESEINELINFDFYEFSDILNELNIKTISPPDSVIEEIVKFAKDYVQ